MADVSGVALTTIKSGPNSDFLSPNATISAKSTTPSALRGKRFRRPSKPAKSTVFRILTETNMSFKSTSKSLED